MIAAQEAERLILNSVEPGPAVDCPLSEACGRILRAPVRADRDSPPFNRVMMDGFALSYTSWRAGKRTFHVQTIVPAGHAPPPLAAPGNTIEVMTGGVLPPGCDMVAPVEWCVREADGVRVAPPVDGPAERWLFVHRTGADGEAGRTVLAPGCRLGPAELAVAATEGALRLTVNRVPRVHLVTTGDEIVPPDARPAAWQIRGSHAVALHSLFRQWGSVHWGHRHATDRDDELAEVFSAGLDEADFLLVTGGVSRGHWDRVPDVMTGCGVDPVFHWVAQKPGKPLWFGRRGPRLVFGLPGNPVSALCTARRYVWPALDRWSGALGGDIRVALDQAIAPRRELTSFRPVCRLGERATPVSPRNSGDLHALCSTDGFVECPPGHDDLPPGKALAFYGWRT